MSTRVENVATSILLGLIDRSYERQSWHGPNLKGSMRGLSAATAAWRPATKRHSIAEIVVHAGYWKYAVRRRLLDEARGSFELKGSNWFAVPEPLDERDWQSMRKLLDNEHILLRRAVESFPAHSW